MNWDRIEGNWKQFKGKVKEQWGKLADSDLDLIKGRRDQLVGKIQEQYGISKDEADRQVGAEVGQTLTPRSERCQTTSHIWTDVESQETHEIVDRRQAPDLGFTGRSEPRMLDFTLDTLNGRF